MKNFLKELPRIAAIICIGSFIYQVVNGYSVSPTDILIAAGLNLLAYGTPNSKNE
jgi:hypothetical protein